MFGAIESFVATYCIDAHYWWGDGPLTKGEYFSFAIGSCWVAGLVVACLWQPVYMFFDWMSLRFFSRYKELNSVQRADWTSRWVGLLFIFVTSVLAVIISVRTSGHTMESGADCTFESEFNDCHWSLVKEIDAGLRPVLYIYYALLMGYETYDIKNCIAIKMPSGVIHHLVLMFILPMAWSITSLSLLAVWMCSLTYLSNIPAHLRSFMAHLHLRDTKIYEYNKQLWWYSYIVLRLFYIPWFSSQMWFLRDPIMVQGSKFLLTTYFCSMMVHYALSLYWFVGMTRTIITSKLRRSNSYPILPRYPNKKDEDEGGQKFD